MGAGGGGKGVSVKNVFHEIMGENFPKLSNQTDIQA